MCSLFRFTADVRSVLSRNLHQHRLWWSSDRELSSSFVLFCRTASRSDIRLIILPRLLTHRLPKTALHEVYQEESQSWTQRGWERQTLGCFRKPFCLSFFFLSLCLTVLPMLIVCELCLCYVCMRTSAVFLFNYLKIWSGWILKQDKNRPFHDLRLQFQFGTSYLTSKGGANGDLLNRLA